MTSVVWSLPSRSTLCKHVKHAGQVPNLMLYPFSRDEQALGRSFEHRCCSYLDLLLEQEHVPSTVKKTFQYELSAFRYKFSFLLHFLPSSPGFL